MKSRCGRFFVCLLVVVCSNFFGQYVTAQEQSWYQVYAEIRLPGEKHDGLWDVIVVNNAPESIKQRGVMLNGPPNIFWAPETTEQFETKSVEDVWDPEDYPKYDVLESHIEYLSFPTIPPTGLPPVQFLIEYSGIRLESNGDISFFASPGADPGGMDKLNIQVLYDTPNDVVRDDDTAGDVYIELWHKPELGADVLKDTVDLRKNETGLITFDEFLLPPTMGGIHNFKMRMYRKPPAGMPIPVTGWIDF